MCVYLSSYLIIIFPLFLPPLSHPLSLDIHYKSLSFSLFSFQTDDDEIHFIIQFLQTFITWQ